MSVEVLKISTKPPYKAPKPWLQAALSRGGRHTVKNAKHRVRVNDKVNFKKEM
jgi:hypothetical protein